MVKPLALLAEGRLQERFLEAIFRPLIDDHKIKTYSTPDATLAIAEAFLIERPDRHIAVVLESQSDHPEDIRENYDGACRRLSRTSPSGEFWHVALAIPSLLEWVLIDDHIRQEYERIRQDPATAVNFEDRRMIEKTNYFALASRIDQVVATHPFDLDKLKHISRQVRELCQFIDKSLQPEPKPEPVLATVADWF
jgi:hypothetical protein